MPTKSESTTQQTDENSQELENQSLESDQDFESEEELDECTASLFEQLEEGYKEQWGTNIAKTIKEGADLYSRVDGELPIHVAARNSGFNNFAMDKILASFTDPAERLEYLKMTNEEGETTLDILATFNENSFGYESSIEYIKRVLSYLELVDQLLYIQETLESQDGHISENTKEFLETISNGEVTIELCDHKKRENAEIEAGYDSGDESLGYVKDVENKKGFVTRVFYKELEQEDGTVKYLPMMELIPSSWRLQTASKDKKQGDHVIAYVLLLQSLAHCRDENIKTLPEHFYNMASALLPDKQDWFLTEKNEVQKKVDERTKARKKTVSTLKHVVGIDPKTLATVEESLKKAETEEIARHIEKVADHFISSVNKLKGESFPQSRKAEVNKAKADGKGILTKKMLSLVDEHDAIAGDDFKNFREKLKAAIEHELQGELGMISGSDLESIAKYTFKTINKSSDKKPKELSSQTKLITFLSTITPLKKYNEGNAMIKIAEMTNKLKKAKPADRELLIAEIGIFCAQLFDYPKVDKPDIKHKKYVERIDDEYVLYEAIPRHLIIVFSAFNLLKDKLTTAERTKIRDVFLDQILKLQLWEGHLVKDKDGNEANLTKDILISKILQFANCVDGNFSMKHSKDYPKRVYSDTRPVFKKTKPKVRKKNSGKKSTNVITKTPKQTTKPPKWSSNLDSFNYVGNSTNLSHQNVSYLINQAFTSADLDGSQTDVVIISEDESLDYNLRDAILKFIGTEPTQDRISIALCRGYLNETTRQIEGNTHWTALHLRRIENADGTISIKSYYMDSMGGAIPNTVVRVLDSIKETTLEDLGDDLSANATYQTAITCLDDTNFTQCKALKRPSKQTDGYSCGNHTVFNMVRMHNLNRNSGKIEYDDNIMQDGEEVDDEQFIANSKATLQAQFNQKNDDDIELNPIEVIMISDDNNLAKLKELLKIEKQIKKSEPDPAVVLSTTNLEKLYKKLLSQCVEEIRYNFLNNDECEVGNDEDIHKREQILEKLSSAKTAQNPENFIEVLEKITDDVTLLSSSLDDLLKEISEIEKQSSLESGVATMSLENTPKTSPAKAKTVQLKKKEQTKNNEEKEKPKVPGRY